MSRPRGRVRASSGVDVEPLSGDWELAACAAGTIESPDAVSRASLDWVRASVPSTAAAALRAAGLWNLDGAVRRFDAEDWWYRCRFTADGPTGGEELWLCCDGLATVCDVWLNGEHLFRSTGMFTGTDRRVDQLLRRENELVFRFLSLDALLRERRPRPRWRAPMVENQQLRWFRTTLLGRTPGWSPPAQAVGPWRDVRLERRRGVGITDIRLRTGMDGQLHLACRAASRGSSERFGGRLILARNGREYEGPLTADAGRLSGTVSVPDVDLWWPHTHGDPALYAARIVLQDGRNQVDVDVGSVGFRSVTLDTSNDGFAVRINGAPVFCRGACWTPLDPVSLNANPAALHRTMAQVVDAGMNMLRVGGMMVYEDDAFLDACDERGVMIWQDFMFANLDYPETDTTFVKAVDDEASQQLERLQGRPSLTVLCGNSEVAQQASMWGASRDRWQPPLFHERLAGIARDACPDVPYWPSSTHGGSFPHQGNAGTASYYGVGAYLRGLDDARRAEVRFASECLAFANIPESRAMTQWPGGPGTKVHDPSWKARTPRDLGAGWDFDDVRDHYVSLLYGAHPMQVRYADHERYLALGRVATGEVMAEVFSEWRRRRSPTRGGLIWFLRDLWHGAGWGVIDAAGTPKAAWHYLRRALAPVAVSLSDEGGNGIAVHVANDRSTRFDGELEISLYRFGEVRVANGVRPVQIDARSAVELNADLFFDEFLDLSYAYRFGAPSHDVIVAALRRAGADEAVARAFHFVPARPNTRDMDVGLTAEARRGAGETYELLVGTRKLAQSVSVEADGFESDDNYFHLAPGERRRLVLRPVDGAAVGALRGVVHALNSATAATIEIRGTHEG
jgi:beta-mannosidase